MKKNILIFAAILSLLIGCKKIDKLTQFDMNYDQTVVIPSSTGINLPFNIFSPDVQSNSETTFAINDTRKDLIEEINLTQLTLDLTSPSNGDFSFLKSIEIFITSSTLEEVKIAWKDNIDSNIGKSLELETTDSDLKEFIKGEEFTLRVRAITDEIITSDHQLDVHSEFFVDAKILGQ